MKGFNLYENKVTNMKITQIKKEGHRYRAIGHCSNNKKQNMSRYVTKKEYDKLKKQKPDDCEELCTIL